MKSIIELSRLIQQDQGFFTRQFLLEQASTRNPLQKNVLFINPQLSGKHLYKMLLPYFVLTNNPNIKTAIQNISRFNQREQIIGGKEADITDSMISWAHYIIFPFTSQPLVAEIYTRIRQFNPACKIIYQIDYNYYELSPKHPHYYIFNDEILLSSVEDNAYFSDVMLISNVELYKFMIEKFTALSTSKYVGRPSRVKVSCLPMLFHSGIVTDNIPDTEYKANQLFQIVGNANAPATGMPLTPPGANQPLQPVSSPALDQKLNEISNANNELVADHKAEKTVKAVTAIKKLAADKQRKTKAKKRQPSRSTKTKRKK